MPLNSGPSNHFPNWKQIENAVRSATEEKPVDLTAFLPSGYDNAGDTAHGISYILRDRGYEWEMIGDRFYAWNPRKSANMKQARPDRPLRISGNMNPRDFMESFKAYRNAKR